MKTKQVFFQGDLLAKTFEPFMMLCIAVKKKKTQAHVADFNARNKSFTAKTSPTGLSVSQTSKDFLKILSPTLWTGF